MLEFIDCADLSTRNKHLHNTTANGNPQLTVNDTWAMMQWCFKQKNCNLNDRTFYNRDIISGPPALSLSAPNFHQICRPIVYTQELLNHGLLPSVKLN